MNRRQEDLLTILLAEKDYIDIGNVAEKLGCSERTIRNNCQYINEWLESFCNMYIKRKTNIGIKLVGDEKEKKIISQKLRREIKRANSEIHRQIEILKLLLLSSKNKITLNELCNQLYTNKNIIREEINKLSYVLKKYDLEIVIKKVDGIIIEGCEKNIRIMIVDFLFEYIDTYRVSIEEMEYFHIVDITAVNNIMNAIEDKLNIRFSDISFKQLTLFLLISIVRIRLGNTLDYNEEVEDIKLEDLIDYIENEIKSTLAVYLNEKEKLFISSLILSMNKEIRSESNKEKIYLDKDLSEYVEKMINTVSEESGINFNDDNLLYDQLLCHLDVTIQQLKNNVYTKNSLLDEIKSKYCFLFTVISDAVKNGDIKGNLNEDEIGYLTLHFQVSLERKTNRREEIKRAIIVCPLSFGVSTLLRIKIEKRFNNIDIVETIREEDLKRNNFIKNIDFIIVFQEYENINIPVFITSPLFTKEDENRLKDFVNQLKTRESTYKIMNKLMISDQLIKELDYDNVYDAIEELGNILVEKHYVGKEYVKSMIDREKTFPTNIGNGILLPHGDIKYVKQSILCFARFKNPVVIKNGQIIKFIIMLAYINDDRQEFQALFKEISDLTEDNNMIKKISTYDIRKIKEILI